MNGRMTWRWRVVATVARLLFRMLLGWRITVRGAEHLPRDGGAVLAFNHHSYADFVMAGWAAHLKARRQVRFLAKREIWSSPFAGWVVRFADAVPVDRASSTSRHGAFSAAVDALASGDLVGVAPEQTISPSLELLPFRTGAARMAQEAHVPIIPCVGWGSQRAFPKGARPRFRWGNPVFVSYLSPMSVPRDADPVTVTAELERRMATELRALQDDYPILPTPGDDAWVPARLGGSAPDHEAVLAEHRAREATWRVRAGDDSSGEHTDENGAQG